MEPNASKIVRVLKRLRAAVGYHELGMTQRAVQCLHSVESLGTIGPFAPVVDILRREIVRNQEDAASIANALQRAACLAPPPARDAISVTLAACYGDVNDGSRTANDMASARGAKPVGPSKPAC